MLFFLMFVCGPGTQFPRPVRVHPFCGSPGGGPPVLRDRASQFGVDWLIKAGYPGETGVSVYHPWGALTFTI